MYEVIVPGVGPMPAQGMIIGEAPGRKEIELGYPFAGASGTVLDAALESCGFGRGDFYVTNVYKGDVGNGNRNPTQREVEAHRQILLDEIAGAKPSGILLLGRVPTESFIPNFTRMSDYVGRRISLEGMEYFPCYHPAATLYDRTKLRDFEHAVITFALTTKVLYEHRQSKQRRNET